MAVALIAILSVVSAAAPMATGEQLAAANTAGMTSADGLYGGMAAELLQALPPPPVTVVRVTQRYGTVTVPHQLHLQARTACKACHGPGPASTISFTPQLAHERCIGCHLELERGPSHCAGCHSRSLPSGTPAALAASAVAKPAPAPAAAPGAAPAAAAAGTSTFRTFTAQWDPGTEPPAATVTSHAPTADAGPSNLSSHFTPSRPMGSGSQVFEAGAAGGSGTGLSLRLTNFGERVVTTVSFERLASTETAWLLGLLGVGVSRNFPARLAVTAQAVGGFDSEERPQMGLLPALGGRLGVAWWPPRGWVVRAVNLSLTGVAFVTATNAFGHHQGGGRLYATLGVALPIPGR